MAERIVLGEAWLCDWISWWILKKPSGGWFKEDRTGSTKPLADRQHRYRLILEEIE